MQISIGKRCQEAGKISQLGQDVMKEVRLSAVFEDPFVELTINPSTGKNVMKEAMAPRIQNIPGRTPQNNQRRHHVSPRQTSPPHVTQKRHAPATNRQITGINQSPRACDQNLRRVEHRCVHEGWWCRQEQRTRRKQVPNDSEAPWVGFGETGWRMFGNHASEVSFVPANLWRWKLASWWWWWRRGLR